MTRPAVQNRNAVEDRRLGDERHNECDTDGKKWGGYVVGARKISGRYSQQLKVGPMDLVSNAAM